MGTQTNDKVADVDGFKFNFENSFARELDGFFVPCEAAKAPEPVKPMAMGFLQAIVAAQEKPSKLETPQGYLPKLHSDQDVLPPLQKPADTGETKPPSEQQSAEDSVDNLVRNVRETLDDPWGDSHRIYPVVETDLRKSGMMPV